MNYFLMIKKKVESSGFFYKKTHRETAIIPREPLHGGRGAGDIRGGDEHAVAPGPRACPVVSADSDVVREAGGEAVEDLGGAGEDPDLNNGQTVNGGR